MLYTAFYLLAPVNAYFSASLLALDAWHFILPVVGLILGALAGWFVNKYLIDKKLGGINNYEQSVHEKAELDAKTLKKEAISEAKLIRDEAVKFKQDAEKEARERRFELNKLEERLGKRDELLDKKDETLIKKQEQIDSSLKDMQKMQSDLSKKQAEIDKSGERIAAEIERVAQMTREQAKTVLVESITSEARRDAALIVRDIENEAKENGEKKAREIITSAIQRCAADQVSEVTISAIPLPNDEMKGRLIGREGRNIRAIENATGVDLIIDDTPEVVVVSGFDPIRRQIAYTTIERLITDGRIHPARIEEMVEKVKKEMDTVIKEAGEAASLDSGVFGLHPEIIKLLGRLKFRVSYGQNVLTHSLEVSYLAGMMAGELGVDVALAKRAGLLHDIGKAVDYEMEGTHIQIGADLARKYKESASVVNAINSHHGDVEPTTIEAVLVAAADAVSSARPGARRETLENYIKRLEKLEEIANSFNGVQKCFAVQAGREIRIIVKPEVVNDSTAILLAKDIAKRIENEMEYPGQIKVSVIRETRSIEFAK